MPNWFHGYLKNMSKVKNLEGERSLFQPFPRPRRFLSIVEVNSSLFIYIRRNLFMFDLGTLSLPPVGFEKEEETE